ncbi:MAG: hypothetical protein K0S22_1808 [Oscillospiraceae bacterium]|nr:hypothetical protein [Oscillospiraceae bacterium]
MVICRYHTPIFKICFLRSLIMFGNLGSTNRLIVVACLMRVYTITDLADFGVFTYPFIMKYAPELFNAAAPPFTLNVRSIGQIVPFGTPDWKNYIDDALWQDFV